MTHDDKTNNINMNKENKCVIIKYKIIIIINYLILMSLLYCHQNSLLCDTFYRVLYISAEFVSFRVCTVMKRNKLKKYSDSCGEN